MFDLRKRTDTIYLKADKEGLTVRCTDCQFSKETIPDKCQHDEKIINAFISGEWCDADDICRLLKISFADGLKCFDFSITAEQNAAPLKGRKITTEFRIKQNPEPPKGE